MTPIITPRLEIYPSRIAENANSILQLCHRHQIQVACVSKVVCAHEAVISTLEACGADMIADSRLENLSRIKNAGIRLPRMLLRIPTPSRVSEVIELADISLVSDLATIKALSAAATVRKIRHQVILMVDLGDLREGIWPDRLMDVFREILRLPALEILGLGVNLACYGGIIPDTGKMEHLVRLRDEARQTFGIDLPVLCGGNSANLPLLLSGGMPPEINLLRIGESILLGRNVLDRSPFPGTRQDTFQLVAEIIELERKPSLPIGKRGQDAFGGEPQFIDRGMRWRAICNIGRQDTVIDNLIPLDPGILVLGGSSDHLILDVENASKSLKTGDEITFFPGYGALLAASTSPYVEKVVLQG